MAVKKILFEQDTSVTATTQVAVAGTSQTLSREQKQFNKLIAQIAATRHELAQWREFVDGAARDLWALWMVMVEHQGHP